MFDTGNTGFMLVSTSLVMLMTPGLAFFYGGLVGRKNVLAIMIQSFVSMGVTTILWYAFGYSLCFSGGKGAIIGNLDMAFMHGITPMTAFAGSSSIPLLVFFVGKRKVADSGAHSIPLVALGTGLLWFGWYGFNAGSELKVDPVTALAFVNTDVAASFAAITWLFIAWSLEKKPKFVGLLTGSIAGLATITPAAGYVTTKAAVCIGILSSVICYMAVNMKNRLGWDDALDVWGVHGVGGVTGVIMLGVFATTTVNASGANGLWHGDAMFFAKEAIAVTATAVYAFLFS
ncbi:MAG: ammonium transporter, partial [Elusimicrobia bacterium]|nr:ammonium transporter [Elusimicrobiota bacterium]